MKIEVLHSTCYTLVLKAERDTPLLYLTNILNIAYPTGVPTPWICKDMIHSTFHTIFIFNCMSGELVKKQEQPVQMKRFVKRMNRPIPQEMLVGA